MEKTVNKKTNRQVNKGERTRSLFTRLLIINILISSRNEKKYHYFSNGSMHDNKF
jgi:hypothetical protein